MSEFLDAAIEAAKKGGAIAMRHFRKDVKVERKSDGSEVTQADKEAEQAILDFLSERFPDHAFMGEEYGKSGENEHTWVIDPIDGTRHYARGTGGWGVLVALLKGDEPIVGVCYAPVEDQLLVAEKGSGVFVDGQPAVLSERPMSDASIYHDNLVLINRQGRLDGIVRLASEASYLTGRAMRDAYHLFFTGAAEGTIVIGVKPWDLLAFAVMGQEMGAVVTDIDGKPIDGESTSLVLARKDIHDEILACFR